MKFFVKKDPDPFENCSSCQHRQSCGVAVYGDDWYDCPKLLNGDNLIINHLFQTPQKNILAERR